MTLLFICLLSLGMGQSLFFAILPPVPREFGHDGNSSQRDFHPVGGFVGHNESVLGAAQRCWGRKPVILLGLAGFGISTGGFGILLALGQQAVLPLMTLYILMVLVRAIFRFFGSGTPRPPRRPILPTGRPAPRRASGVAAIGAAFGMGTSMGPGFAARFGRISFAGALFCSVLSGFGRVTGDFSVSSCRNAVRPQPMKKKPPN